MSLHPNIRLQPIQAGFDVDDCLLLRVPHLQQLQVLQPEAATIWRGIAAGLDDPDIANAIATQTEVATKTVLEDIQCLKQSWQEQGLLVASHPVYTLDYGTLAIAIELDTPADFQKQLSDILPGLRTGETGNWDHILKVSIKNDFYAIELDGESKFELLYRDAAFSQLLLELEQLRTYQDYTPNLINAAMMTFQQQLLCFTTIDVEQTHVVALELATQGAQLHAIAQVELGSNQQLLPIQSPLLVSHRDVLADTQLKSLLPASVSFYQNQQVQHVLPYEQYYSNPNIAGKTPILVLLRIVGQSKTAARTLHSADVLDALLRAQRVPWHALKQYQVQQLLDWILATECVELTLPSLAQCSSAMALLLAGKLL